MDLHCLRGLLCFLKDNVDWKQMLKQSKDRVFEFLKTAFRLITGLPRSMSKVKEEHLLKIHKYLESNEAQATDNEQVKETLKMIISIKHLLEDAADRYDLLLQQRNELSDEIRLSSGFLTKLKKRPQLWALYAKQVKPMYEIASTVARMETGLQEARLGSSSNGIRNQGREIDYGEWTRLPKTEEYYLVGLEDQAKEIIKELDLEFKKNPSLMTKDRFLVAMYGEGGVGKTTLVKKVYDEVRRIFHFQLSASVTVSQTYDPEAILKEILKQFGAPDDAEEIFQAFQKLDISNKRYIVVLDDVWDIKLCNYIQKALTCAQKGSRILLTTRLEIDVARHWCRTFVGRPYECHRMSEDDALKLISRKVFKNDDCNNDEVKRSSLLEIIRKCPLLPLVISAVGGLLSEDESNWYDVSENLGRELRDVEDIFEKTKKILLYSYYSLPHEIRSCFLYFGMFPEDHEIEVDRLIRIWVAEGFVTRQPDRKLEKVAEMYLDKLRERGLVTITCFNESEFIFQKLAKVHDILHVITRDKIKEIGFGQVLTNESSSCSGFRRLSLNNVSDTLDLDPAAYRVPRNFCSFRSIMLNHCESFPNYLLSLSPEITNCLRVMHLEACEIADEFPDEIKHLHNLRFLKLGLRNIQVVPEFIGQFLKLDTLEITAATVDGSSTKLPQELKRLKKLLRHLSLSSKVEIPVGVLGSLTRLQTLYIHLNVSESAALVEELGSLNLLTTLHVNRLKHNDVRAFLKALQGKDKLLSLQVWVSKNSENTSIYSETESWISCPPKNLKKLTLSANLGERLPLWFEQLRSLESLSFDITRNMRQDQLEAVKQLPNLQVLRLYIDHGARLNFGEREDCKKLKFVAIMATCQLQSISGVLPSLQRLYLQARKPLHIAEHILKKTVFSLRGGVWECCICLEKYDDEQEVRQLPCSHILHKDCVGPWLEILSFCPFCREGLESLYG